MNPRWLALGLLLVSGCHGIAESPTAPTLTPPVFPSSPAPPSTPPFAVALEGMPAVAPGRWPVLVSITVPRGVIPSETPDVLRVTCAGHVLTRQAAIGSVPLACEFPTVGEYQVEASVMGSAGFQANRTMRVTVGWPSTTLTGVFYSVLISDSGSTNVAFSLRTFEDARTHAWDFSDGSTETTLLPSVTHRFTTPSSGSNERRVTVRALRADGSVIATGAVAGRW